MPTTPGLRGLPRRLTRRLTRRGGLTALAVVLLAVGVDEAAVVAVGGWLLGLALARVGLAVLPRLQGAYLPSSVEIGLSPAVVLSAAAVATAGAILPALAAARVALRGRGVPLAPWLERGAERRSEGLPGWLPTLQVAVSCTVLACAGLLVRSSLALAAIDPPTLILVAGLLAAGVLLASAVPAARAARVDPTVALDSD